MTTIAVIGAGSVGTALGRGLAAAGHEVTYGVRNPADPRHQGLLRAALPSDAAVGAQVVVLAVPASAVAETVPGLGLVHGQVLVDATNAVGTPVPHGFATMGDLVASHTPDGVHLVKAFNTVGAEHLGDGRTRNGGVFLPIAGDPTGVETVTALASDLGHDVVAVGGREFFGMVEDHARLWIRLAFGCGWGRQFAFNVARP